MQAVTKEPDLVELSASALLPVDAVVPDSPSIEDIELDEKTVRRSPIPPPPRLPSIVARTSIPSTLPPPPRVERPLVPRAPSPDERTEIRARPELDDEPTRPRARWYPSSRLRVLPVALGGLAGLFCFALLILAARSVALGRTAEARDALIVTLSDDVGRPVPAPRVFVDGVSRCEASPCRIHSLDEGAHFVSALAPGHTASAARVIHTNRNETGTLHIELVPVLEAPAADPAPVPVVSAPFDASASTPARPKTPWRPAQPASAQLSFDSSPASHIVLDGRPLGATPKLAVPVSPGSHSVVFVHPELGRRARTVAAHSGELESVQVRF